MGVQAVVDSAIDGAKLTAEGQKIIQTGYAAGLIWGRDAVNTTKTDLDNQGLEVFMKLCADTAAEGAFPLVDFAVID